MRDWGELRARAEELLEKTPFQQVRDSPTVKYYTDWGIFESRMNLGQESCPGPPRHNAEILLWAGLSVVDKAGLRVEPLREGIAYIYDGPFSLVGPTSKILALHMARWGDGVYIHIPRGVRLERPLRIAMCGGLNGYVGHHVYIEAEGDGRILFHEYVPRAGNGLKTTVIEGYVGPGASLEIATVVEASKLAPIFHLKRISLGEGASVSSTVFTLGGRMNHVREEYILAGGGSEASVKAGIVVRGVDRADLITNVIHEGVGTRSRIKARGVAFERGVAIHRGVAKVRRTAAEADTEIDSRIIVASPSAKGYSTPMLEIDTNRVKNARHATAVATIEEEQLFYLRSRGLSEDEAKNLILNGLLTVLIEEQWAEQLNLPLKRALLGL